MTPIRMISKPASQCIVLNEDEKKLFSLLRECCQYYNLGVTLRVAGGWVRDKLLGMECKDCDIAIDKMMGQSFAERLREFLISRHIPTSAYGIIQANPERSKHLETATLTIFGYPIDFVNLRAEAYTQSSRIPSAINFGSPLQDALRRDITINSLFYNIHNEEVEDFCGTAFQDLQDQLIRAPLPAKETLMDDPLRLLRVIRFATRLQFRIEETLQAAIMDEEVDTAFRLKISRERVGAELEKILTDRHALDGLRLLNLLGIFNLVFDVPSHLRLCALNESTVDFPPFPNENLVNTILRLCHDWVPTLASAGERKLAFLAAVLIPYSGVQVGRKAPKKPEPLTTVIIRDSIKFMNHDYSDVNQLLDPIDDVVGLILDGVVDPIKCGRLIRRLGRHWRIGIRLASIRAIISGRAPDLPQTQEQFTTFINTIHQLELHDCWAWKPKLSGGEVQTLFGLTEGRQVGIIINSLLDWQSANPAATKDDAIAFFGTYNVQKLQNPNLIN